MNLKVMSYNIMSGKDYIAYSNGQEWNDPTIIKPELSAKVIAEIGADIVGLNEVHGMGGNFDEQAEVIAELSGYSYCYFAPAIVAQNSPYGNAVLSKYPIITADTVMIPDSGEFVEDMSETRCVARVTIALGEQNIDVLVTHFGLLDSERTEAVKLIKELVDETKNPCIVMGDFNCEPNSHYIQQIKTILKDTAIEKEKLDNEQMTYSSIIPQKKIDYIFVNSDFDVINANAIDATASDHRPYVAELIL